MSDFTEMVAFEEGQAKQDAIVNNMTNNNCSAWASFEPATPEEKKNFFNAMSAEGTPLMDCNGRTLEVKDVIIMPVTVIGDDGEENIVPRVVLIGIDGVYTATSWGAYRSLQRMAGIFGGLHFDPPCEICVKIVKTKKGKTINFELL